MRHTGCDLVVGVTPSATNLSKTYYLSSNQVLQPFAEATVHQSYIRRQNLPRTYAENGAIFLQRVNSLRHPPQNVPNFGSLRSMDARPYIMPEERAIDVDTPFDLHLARLLMKAPFTNAEHP